MVFKNIPGPRPYSPKRVLGAEEIRFPSTQMPAPASTPAHPLPAYHSPRRKAALETQQAWAALKFTGSTPVPVLLAWRPGWPWSSSPGNPLHAGRAGSRPGAQAGSTEDGLAMPAAGNTQPQPDPRVRPRQVMAKSLGKKDYHVSRPDSPLHTPPDPTHIPGPPSHAHAGTHMGTGTISTGCSLSTGCPVTDPRLSDLKL